MIENAGNVGFIIGHNLPGCIPDGTPDFYPDSASAQFGWVDMVEEALEASKLDLLEFAKSVHWARCVTPEDLDLLAFDQEINLAIEGRMYWITKRLDVSDIVGAEVLASI